MSNQKKSHEERLRDRRRIAKAVEKGGGKNVDEIAEKFSVSVRHVRNCCKEFNVKTYRSRGRNAGHLASSTYEVIADIIRGVYSLSEIGERHKLSKSRVASIKRELNAAKVLDAVDDMYVADYDEYHVMADILARKPFDAIAERHGTTEREVRRIKKCLVESGIVRMFEERGKKALNIADVSSFKIAGDLMEGLSVAEISEEMEVRESSVQAVKDRARRAGLID